MGITELKYLLRFNIGRTSTGAAQSRLRLNPAAYHAALP